MTELAEGQHGVVSRDQLLRLGISKSSIGRETVVGVLRRVHRGIYVVGYARLSPHGRCMAALLACGREAVLSHDSAAWLWGIAQWCPAIVEVTVPSGANKRSDIVLHSSRNLGNRDRTEYEEIPVTSVARTLIDIAATRSRRNLEQVTERTARRGLLDLTEIDATLAHTGPIRGRGVLLDVLDLYRDPGFTRSRAELLFLDLVKKAGLPRPSTNVFVAGCEIDAYWEKERFAVEIDGWSTHGNRAAFEADPVRQEDLKLAGIDSIRLTARRIEREPRQIAKRMAALLAQRRRELEQP